MALAPEPKRDNEVYDDIAILRRVATSVNQSLDINETLHTGLDETMRLFGVNAGGVYIFDEKNQILNLQLYHNFTKPFVERLSIVKPGSGCAGTVVQTGEIFAEVGEKHRYICKDAEELMGIDCLVAAPIKSKGRVLGVLELFAPFGRNLSEREARIVNTIGDFLGTAVENAQIHEQLSKALKNSEILLDATETMAETLKIDELLVKLGQLVKQITNLKRVAISIYDREKEELSLAMCNDAFVTNGQKKNLNELDESIKNQITRQTAFEIYDSEKLPSYIKEQNTDKDAESLLSIPFVFQNRVSGLMSLDNPGENHTFTEEEIELAVAIARQAAAVIENAKSFENQRKIAITLQKAFMPKKVPVRNGITVSTVFRSATKEPGIIGGDFFDFTEPGENQIGFVIGDVSGKGVEATSIASMVKNTIQVFANQSGSPGRVLSLTNQFLKGKLSKSQFITVYYGILYLDSLRFIYSTAGHMVPIRINASHEFVDKPITSSLPLGIQPRTIYRDNFWDLKRGDFLLLYTDGATDARSDDQFFGEESLLKSVISHCREEKNVLDGILKDILKFCKNKFADDIAMVGVQIKT